MEILLGEVSNKSDTADETVCSVTSELYQQNKAKSEKKTKKRERTECQ